MRLLPVSCLVMDVTLFPLEEVYQELYNSLEILPAPRFILEPMLDCIEEEEEDVQDDWPVMEEDLVLIINGKKKKKKKKSRRSGTAEMTASEVVSFWV